MREHVNNNKVVFSETTSKLIDYYDQPLKIGDEITFSGGSASDISYSEGGTIIDIFGDKLIVKNNETGKIIEIPPGSSVLNNGEYYIDDLDWDDLEKLPKIKPVTSKHPWRIKSQLTPAAQKTFGDLISEL